jgi:hypothetical protein
MAWIGFDCSGHGPVAAAYCERGNEPSAYTKDWKFLGLSNRKENHFSSRT